jgi:hypothetical protein
MMTPSKADQTRQPKSAMTHDPVTKQRKPIPEEIDPDFIYVDERVEIIEMYAPECLDRKIDGIVQRDSSEFTSFWGDPTVDVGIYKRQGYIPVVDPNTKEQVNHKGDPLFKRARELFEKHRRRSEGISRKAAEAALEAEDEDSQQEQFTTAIPRGG